MSYAENQSGVQVVTKFVDSYFDSPAEAYEEALRRRLDSTGDQTVTRVEPSSYGGWRVRTTPIEMLIDFSYDGGTSNSGYRSNTHRTLSKVG